MELTSRMKMARFQTFWIQIQKNKPLAESCKTGLTSGTKMAFYSFIKKRKRLYLKNLKIRTPLEQQTMIFRGKQGI
ncbi:hypothetical protein Hanom_Chr08g00712451 [Helianthus anomalus]